MQCSGSSWGNATAASIQTQWGDATARQGSTTLVAASAESVFPAVLSLLQGWPTEIPHPRGLTVISLDGEETLVVAYTDFFEDPKRSKIVVRS